MSGYNEMCKFCQERSCDGCPLPFRDDMDFEQLMKRVGISNNESFYWDGYDKGRKDVVFEIVWNNKINTDFLSKLQTAVNFPN